MGHIVNISGYYKKGLLSSVMIVDYTIYSIIPNQVFLYKYYLKKIKCRVFIISKKSVGCLWANHGFYAFPLLFLQHIELGSLTLSLITNRICQYNTVGILHLVKGMLTT